MNRLLAVLGAVVAPLGVVVPATINPLVAAPLVAGAAVVVQQVVVEDASAVVPSADFAEASLRGQTTADYAPDNDIAANVNYIQATCWNDAGTAHIDIVQVYREWSQVYGMGPDSITEQFAFKKANGVLMHRKYYAGWWGSPRVYHDIDARTTNNYCTNAA